MNDETNYLSKEKFDEFTKELKELKSVKRKEVAGNLEYAKSLGDLAENAEYHEARAQQADIEERIAKLELILKALSISRGRAAAEIGVDKPLVGRWVSVWATGWPS